MTQTSIYHRSPGGHPCKPLIVSTFILERAVQNLKATGHIIVRLYTLKTEKPNAARYLIKEFRGNILHTNLTYAQAKGLVPQIQGKGRLVIAEESVVKKRTPKMILNRSVVTRKRKAMGLTKNALSVRCGLGSGYLSWMDRKAISPTPYTIKRIAVGLGCEVKEICWV